MSTANTATRYHALDSLRASMMLLGIYLHVSCAYCNLPDVWWYRDAQRSMFFDATLLFIHVFRMPVFMVMAGFFSALLVERRHVTGFLKNRALRIGVPLVGGVLLLYPLLWLMGAYGRAIGKADPFTLAWNAFVSGRWVRHMDTTHLWFLNYLLYLYVIAVVVRWAARPIAERVSYWFGKMLTSWVRFVILPLLTFATLSTMNVGLLDTENDWIPEPRILAAYAVFFGFGWLLYAHRHVLQTWTRFAWTQVLLTLPLFFVNLIAVDRQLKAAGRSHDQVALLVTAMSGAIMVWLMVFGLTGLFLRYFGQASPKWRYLSDSAYWQYIMHSPVVLFWQLAFAPLAMSALLKCALVTVLSAVVLLVTYELFVRTTWIGVLLNGQRYPRALMRRREPLAVEARA